VAAPALPPGLIDSDILIDAERGTPQAIQFSFDQRAAGPLMLSVVTAMELIRGCRNAQDLAALTQFFQHTSIIQIQPAISQLAFDWMETFHLSHGLEIADALIAATAVSQQLILYTRNIRHFQSLPGLRVVRPY